LGGTKTVKLCESCHGKIHNLNFTNHGLLIKAGIKKSLKKMGRPKESGYTSDQILQKHKDIVDLLLNNSSIRASAKKTGKGISTVQRVKKILDSHQNAS